MIDDLLSANSEQEYFLGTIVLHQRNNKNEYDVVDGQQRITSIMIFLACLRDLVKDQQYKKGIQDKILQPKNVVDGIQEKIRLEVKDREIFNKLVLKDGGSKEKIRVQDLPEPEWRYVNATKIFYTKLSQLNEQQLQKLINFTSQKCVVISLATSTFDDAFRLFTIVNDRGKQLRRTDILKSINIAPDVVVKETVRTRIAQKWEEYEKDLTETVFEGILHLIRLILLKDKPQGDLLKEFENRIFSRGIVSRGESFFECVFDYISLYKKIFIEKDFLSDDENANKFKALIHIMDCEFVASE